MAVDSTNPRGLSQDPDRVLRSPSRWLLVAGAGFLVAVGLLFAIGGAFAPLGEGEERSWFPVVLGVQLTTLGVTMAVALWAPRRSSGGLPAAVPAPGGGVGVALPLRRAPRVASLVGLSVVASLGVNIAAAAHGAGVVLLGFGIVAFGVALIVVSARAAAREVGAIVLDPESLTLPAGTTPRATIAWRDLSEVAVTGGWQPHLVVTYKGPGLSTSRLLSQAWPPRALVEVVEYYRTHRDARAGLTDPGALDRFRR